MSYQISIYTDGSCLGNPGNGGIGCIIKFPFTNDCYKLGLGYYNTTNNRMELRAVIEALRFMEEGDYRITKNKIQLYTDSQYVIKGITEWIKGWKKNNWKTSNKQDVKNKDLWQILDSQVSNFDIDWNWVKGHNGHIENEECDTIAKRCAGCPEINDIIESINDKSDN